MRLPGFLHRQIRREFPTHPEGLSDKRSDLEKPHLTLQEQLMPAGLPGIRRVLLGPDVPAAADIGTNEPNLAVVGLKGAPAFRRALLGWMHGHCCGEGSAGHCYSNVPSCRLTLLLSGRPPGCPCSTLPLCGAYSMRAWYGLHSSPARSSTYQPSGMCRQISSCKISG